MLKSLGRPESILLELSQNLFDGACLRLLAMKFEEGNCLEIVYSDSKLLHGEARRRKQRSRERTKRVHQETVF